MQTFSENSVPGSHIFYREGSNVFSYFHLIDDSKKLVSFFDDLNDEYILLQFHSSYQLFAHLLAGLHSKKKFLIVSPKEPLSALEHYKLHFPFTKIIKDHDFSSLKTPGLLKDVPMDQTVFNILSSGSTGPAKSIPLSLQNIYQSSKGIIDFFEMNASHTTLMNLPHNHIGGLMILWRAFFSGACVSKNAEEKFQFISLVPLQLKRMFESASDIKKLQECRAVLIGGAPFLEDLKEKAKQLNISTYETYGMSETSSLVMLNGVPLEGQSIKLDENNHFLIKGKTISSIMPLDDQGFYHTKDVGLQKADGSFSFVERSDLLFKSAGEMIDPLKLEAIIKKHPAIKNAVVVSVPHNEWTNAATLVYQTDDKNLTNESLKDYLKQELHPHLIPKYFLIAPESLMNSEMKPKRFEIKNFALKEVFKDKLHYLYIPQNNATKLMVYFHGFMEDHTDMIALMDNHHGFNHLFIDLPGHGKSLIKNSPSRQDIFSNLEYLIKALQNHNELYFYGYSMGGRVALELINRGLRPVLCFVESASFGLSSLDEKTSRQNQDAHLFDNFENHSIFFDKWYSNPLFGNYRNHPHYKSDIEKKSSHSYLEWQKSLEFLSPGAAPSLLKENIHDLGNQKIVGIFGSNDEKYKRHFQEIKNDLVNLVLVEIENAAHNPHKTHLSEVKKIISRFI